jgi:large subunit ribosomal protein L25
MSNNLQLSAEIRTDAGKGASRRLRHSNKIPGIIYGAGKAPQSITLEHHQVAKALENEEFFSQILTLNVNSTNEQVVLKDLQRHPIKPIIMHMDFLRIKADEELTMHIPLHFIGADKAPGIKQGGIISHAISEIEIRCLPANLPKYIEIDTSAMNVNDIIHLSDIKLPQGVKIPILQQGEEYDQPVVTLHMPRAETEEVPITEVAASEVEVITAKAEKEEASEDKAEGKDTKGKGKKE